MVFEEQDLTLEEVLTNKLEEISKTADCQDILSFLQQQFKEYKRIIHKTGCGWILVDKAWRYGISIYFPNKRVFFIGGMNKDMRLDVICLEKEYGVISPWRSNMRIFSIPQDKCDSIYKALHETFYIKHMIKNLNIYYK